MTPNLTLSCCVSADGYLDDQSDARAILSSPEDLDAVLALRATMDMIVVGAETVRRDDPSLATRGEKYIRRRARDGRAADPVKVILTRSGDLPRDRQIWTSGSAETIVLSQSPSDAPATVIQIDEDPIEGVMALAKTLRCQDILIEGGADILTQALPRARWFRLAVSPKMLGDQGRAPLFDPDAFLADNLPVFSQVFGDTTVHHIDLHLIRARALMHQAFALSENCPPSESAFAVGCIGCDADMTVLATGYSRETGPKDHAEEAMLAKLNGVTPHTVICTLEPCLSRASKPMGCAERLVAAGTSRLYYALIEDGTFTEQKGLAYLQDNGVELIHLPGFERSFQSANRPIYHTENASETTS